MKDLLLPILIGLLAVVLLSLVAGAADKLLLRTVAKGAFSGISEAKQEVLKDQKAWEKFWASHSVKEQQATQVPKVDFAKEMVIAVTMGRKNSGGYAIEITDIESGTQTLKICIKRTSPSPGSMVITALTAPFHFVAATKSDLKPEFVEALATGKK